ncbi:hypothetical protein D3C86_1784210 [compost metagenome]
MSDVGDLARGTLALDREGRLVGLEGLGVRRLTLTDGAPISQKIDGDAEGLAVTADGDLIVSFERDHRIWNYGPLTALRSPQPCGGRTSPSPRTTGWRHWRRRATAGGWRANPAGSGTVRRRAAWS